MAQCFQLFDKTTGEVVNLHKLDELICTEVLHVEVHPKMYGGGYVEGSCDWISSIGYAIATHPERYLGSTALRERLSNGGWNESYSAKLLKILDYLEERYTSTAFYQTKNG